MMIVSLFILSDMANKRDEHVAFRISSEDKAKLLEIAQREERPLSNLIARIVRKYLNEIQAAEQAARKG